LLGMVAARVRRYRGQYEAAQLHAQQALDSCGEVNDDSAFIALACMEELALCHWALGELDEAQALLARTLSLAQRYDARFVEGRALALLGIIRNASGDAQEARLQLEAGIRIFEELRDGYQVAFAQRGLSYVLLRLGDLEGQLRLATDALQAFREAGYPHEIGEALFAVVVAHDAAGRPAEAARVCREALGSCLATGQVPVALRCIGALGAFAVPDDRALGVTLMRFAARHPALRKPDLAFIEERLAAIGATAAEVAAGNERAGALDFDGACRLAMDERAAR
jgi:ATP/maltotriose-dependent transcriptional regulator MalT